jgi:hypothetical protein
MKAVYPPAQVAPYDPSFFGASPLATRRTRLATRAASGLAVTTSDRPPHLERYTLPLSLILYFPFPSVDTSMTLIVLTDPLMSGVRFQVWIVS